MYVNFHCCIAINFFHTKKKYYHHRKWIIFHLLKKHFHVWGMMDTLFRNLTHHVSILPTTLDLMDAPYFTKQIGSILTVWKVESLRFGAFKVIRYYLFRGDAFYKVLSCIVLMVTISIPYYLVALNKIFDMQMKYWSICNQ